MARFVIYLENSTYHFELEGAHDEDILMVGELLYNTLQETEEAIDLVISDGEDITCYGKDPKPKRRKKNPRGAYYYHFILKNSQIHVGTSMPFADEAQCDLGIQNCIDALSGTLDPTVVVEL